VISLELAAEFGLATEKIPPLRGGGGRMNASRVQLSSLAVGASRQENLTAAASDFLAQLNAALGSKLYCVKLDYPRAALSLE